MKRQQEIFSEAFQESFPCAYFGDGRTASVEYVIAGAGQSQRFDEFLARGYRRLGRIFYRNVCRDCSSCIPLRLEVGEFCPSRSQKRTLKKNGNIRLEILAAPVLTFEKVELYRKYLRSKHGEVEEAYRDIEHMLSLYHGSIPVIEMSYYLEDRLVGVGIVDEGENSLSSNYFFYDTDFLPRRPGVFSILSEIALARQRGKRYYYLGFHIEEVGKMSYKKHFRPNQVLAEGTWEEFLR
ncbi:MAG: arginyltransferase [Alphaproteobacteria bacterium]|uniref:Arginyltransferase n=1 Tax=Candidatus Nitrobium versatile TaxID=2884831 RepID=A0A953JGF9_9BACT|nr:arginyltransferase [Candidatus Nitrobium versatile]